MEIVDYELFNVPVPKWQFIRLETSDGTVGWGEPGVEGRPQAVKAATVELLENHIIGEDPQYIGDLWQTMFRSGFFRGGHVHMSAIAGIDQALWDIKGKVYGAPVHELLGGKVRNRMRVYGHINLWKGDSPDGDDLADSDQIAEEAAQLKQNGYQAIKVSQLTPAVAHLEAPNVIEESAVRIQAIRDAIGDDVSLAIDTHARQSKGMAIQLMKALESSNILWFEEPVLPEFYRDLPDIRARTSTPIAVGERLHSRFDFKELLINGGVDVVQPDLSHAGGISEVTKIANLAETFDVAFAPHCPLGPLALASCLQVDAIAPNAFIQEEVINQDRLATAGEKRAYVENSEIFNVTDGSFPISDRPGLGVTINESHVRAQSKQNDSHWYPPTWRHEDNSLAQW